ncbi:hypothetical protein [Laspinema palackyanum]|nr:hypothetical protein [Laspinema sp. D2c]
MDWRFANRPYILVTRLKPPHEDRGYGEVHLSAVRVRIVTGDRLYSFL